MPQPHTIITVQGGRGKTVDVTRWDPAANKHQVEKTEDLPLAGGGNLAQYQLDEGQSLQVYNKNREAEGEWVWLNPTEAEIVRSMREANAAASA